MIKKNVQQQKSKFQFKPEETQIGIFDEKRAERRHGLPQKSKRNDN